MPSLDVGQVVLKVAGREAGRIATVVKKSCGQVYDWKLNCFCVTYSGTNKNNPCKAQTRMLVGVLKITGLVSALG